jgi:hypothetical protein
MATGAAHRRIVTERLVEQRLAAMRRIGGLRGQTGARGQLRIGQEGDFLDVGFQRINDLRRRLGAGEFVDDGIANEIAQRREAPVMRIGRQIFRPAQARRRDRIEHAVVGLGIEQRPADIERPRPARQAGDEQLGIVVALLMAAFAADAGLARHPAEDRRRGKQQVAEIEQIRALAAGQLGSEQLGRLVEQVLVKLGAERQHAFPGGNRRRLRRAEAQRQHGDGRQCRMP